MATNYVKLITHFFLYQTCPFSEYNNEKTWREIKSMPRKHKITGNNSPDPFDDQFSSQDSIGDENEGEQAGFVGGGRDPASPFDSRDTSSPFDDGMRHPEAGK